MFIDEDVCDGEVLGRRSRWRRNWKGGQAIEMEMHPRKRGTAPKPQARGPEETEKEVNQRD
jgi:hypothetical protein